MEIPSYKFSKESEELFLEFLKVSNDKKLNQFCNLQKYEKWKEILPLNSEFKHLLKISVHSNCSSVIEISDSEEYVIQSNIGNEIDNEISDNPTAEDLAYTVKEHLETMKAIPRSIITDIHSCPENILKDIFCTLAKELNSEHICYLGCSLEEFINQQDDHIIISFCKYLLIPQIKMEFTDNLGKLFIRFMEKFPNTTIKELLETIYNEDMDINSLYINGLNDKYKNILISQFLERCDRLSDRDITMLNNLLNSELEYDILKKIVEIMSNNADEYSTDKAYGKMLMNIVQYLGKDLSRLENPLKHILGIHKSIWKAKLQKMLNSLFEDSLLTQTFRI